MTAEAESKRVRACCRCKTDEYVSTVEHGYGYITYCTNCYDVDYSDGRWVSLGPTGVGHTVQQSQEAYAEAVDMEEDRMELVAEAAEEQGRCC